MLKKWNVPLFQVRKYRGSYLVTIEWNFLNIILKTLAFVGKGVCFDTGGYLFKASKIHGRYEL